MSIEAVVAALYAEAPEGARNVGAVAVLRVLLALAEHADEDGRGNYPAPSQATLAELLGLDRRDVRNALAALVEQGRIRKVADAVQRRSGDVYDIARRPSTRAGDPAELGRGIPAPVDDELGRGIRPEHMRDSGGGLGRGTRAGDPRRDPDPDPENPPTPLCDGFDVDAANLGEGDDGSVGEKLDLERVRAVLETNGAARRLIGRRRAPTAAVGEPEPVPLDARPASGRGGGGFRVGDMLYRDGAWHSLDEAPG